MAKLELRDLLGFATAHGEASEPDHEVGDLQDMLTVAWNLMTDSQKQQFFSSPEVEQVVESVFSDEALERLEESQAKPPITITVKGGVVTGVENVPDGWQYVIDDKDLTEHVCHGPNC
jgi:hypothetical protein